MHSDCIPATKACYTCNQVLPLAAFTRNRRKVDGLNHQCRACVSAWAKAHRPQISANKRAYYRANREAVLAEHKRQRERAIARDPDGYRMRRTEAVRRWALRLKREVVDAYGGRCACCGEAELTFLTVEHVNHDRKAHLARVGDAYGIWRDLKDRGFPKDGFAVLCMNCNWAQRYGDPCPHRR